MSNMMNRKAKRLKRELGGYKVAAITNIALAVCLWIYLAFISGVTAISQAPIFNGVLTLILLVMMGLFLLINGIKLLQFVSKTREVLQDIVPDDD